MKKSRNMDGWKLENASVLAQAAVSLIRMMPRNPAAIGGIAMWYASAAAATGCDTSGVAPISSFDPFPLPFFNQTKISLLSSLPLQLWTDSLYVCVAVLQTNTT